MTVKIPDGEVDKKFKYIETVLKRMSRRLHKTVAVAVPPIPMTHYAARVDGDNTLFRYFFIVDCVLSRFMLAISSMSDAKSVGITVRLSNEGSRSSKTFTVKSGQNVLDLQGLASVESGTIMKVYLNDPITIGEYWLGFLMDIDPGSSKIIRGTIDALEESTNVL